MKPRNIFLIRHGESEGNVDKTIYSQKPDYALNLTDKGIEQAKLAGTELKTQMAAGGFAVYYSPFFRSIQTFNHILSTLDKKNVDMKYLQEDPRIREQEWHGNIPENYDESTSEQMENECHMYGKFFYRFIGGESSADVYDRVSDFINSMHRDFDNPDYPNNVLIVSHGMTMRVFLHRWFKKSVYEFETWKNPNNCKIWKLTKTLENKYNFDFSNIPLGPVPHQFRCKLEL